LLDSSDRHFYGLPPFAPVDWSRSSGGAARKPGSRQMNLIVKGQQIDVGEALRTHVHDNLDGVFDKYFGDAIDVTVTFSRDAHLFRAAVAAHVGRGIMAQSEATADQAYAAFDLASDRLAKRLRRHKRWLRGHHKLPFETRSAGHYVLAADEETVASESEAEGDEWTIEAPNGQPTVIAEMKSDIPTLTVSEAVRHLDLADCGALMFVNRAHGGLNMVYRRTDGNVGWVDPKGNSGA
jgi:ribosomal subunit interface protein